MSWPPPVYLPPANPHEEGWDQAQADGLLGKYALVGVTWLDPDGETVKAQGQYHGRIFSVDRTNGIDIACEGQWAGETMSFPPATSWFSLAQPGRYHLRSTDEVIVDPDFTSNWTIKSAS